MANVDKQEVNKFSDIANEWWNKNGDLEPGDMLLILERLKNKDLISCSLTEKKDF